MSSNKSRRTPVEWRELLKEQALSGQTQVDFCRERGISLPAFSNALSRFRDQPGFVEIAPVKASGVQAWEGEVIFPNGVTIRVRG